MADIMYFLACTRSNGVRDPNITALVYESTGSEFDPNSPLYKTDTTIEGINGGTDDNSGVNLTIARTQATPSSVNLNELVELVMLNVSYSPFGKRSFIRLKKEIDRDVRFNIKFVQNQVLKTGY